MTVKPILSILLFVLCSSNIVAQPVNDRHKVAPLLFQMLEEYHYSPPERNSALSNQIFGNLMKTLDPYQLLFTAETISGFQTYRDSLCTKNPKVVAEFISTLAEKYQERIHFADSMVDLSFQSPMNLTELDSLILEPEDDGILPKNDLEMKERWAKWLKHQLLRSLMYSGNDSLATNSPTIPDSLYASGSLLAKKTRIREKRRLSQLLNYSGGIENFVANSFLNSVTSCFDPHSNYFSVEDKTKFESSLSKENYAFGFELGSNLNEEVIISRILPGSPLWYSEKLEKGDVILKIKLPDQEETDLAFASISEVDNLFQTYSGNEVEMTVRKLNGSTSTIELSKGKFDTKENQTVGFILKGEKPIGYVWFSSFYTQFGRWGNVGCSIDLLKEIVKLKESGIAGLVVDLRNNPGGSEGEAMEIAAYFTGDGPFAIRMNKDRQQNTLGKVNAVKWYDDPMVVLVNRNSASGSELLAAILQNYNRAIIIGSETFGKASEQLVFPIGRKMAVFNPVRNQEPNENYGFAKVTTGKIFRINGKSYQQKGVTPDILLPDLYENFTKKEADMPFALINDSIIPSVKFTPLPELPIDSLAKISKSRIVSHEKFNQINKLNESLKALVDDKQTTTLNLSRYKSESDQIKQLMSEFEQLQSSENAAFTVENSPFRLTEIQSDSLEMEMNTKFKSSVQKDIYIGEAYSVILDLLKMDYLRQKN